mmetsp:Transcript_22974/g.42660  ORF Transcript_22974/g.42660 Transcript_22974/m.42660 type:complete len:107 (-) Transcript_22974:311-631(-)
MFPVLVRPEVGLFPAVRLVRHAPYRDEDEDTNGGDEQQDDNLLPRLVRIAAFAHLVDDGAGCVGGDEDDDGQNHVVECDDEHPMMARILAFACCPYAQYYSLCLLW